MTKRRRRPYYPLASQPRSPDRRPGNFNEQAYDRPDPNVDFIAGNSSAVGGDPTSSVLRLFGALHRAVARKGRNREPGHS